MTGSTLRPLIVMTHPFARGHNLVGRGHGQVRKDLSVPRPAPDITANRPAGSVFSDPDDLSRFTIAPMNRGATESST